MKHSISYRPEIDALRGIAVLFVVAFHAFPDTFSGGYIGVDVFFVISGFLITKILLNNPNLTLLNFYDRRVRRLFPALLTVLITSLILGWLFLYPEELQRLGKHIVRASLYVLNFTLLSEADYFDVETLYKPLMHLWSLSVEEQFYLFWPIVLLLLMRRENEILSPFNVILLISAISFIINIYFFVFKENLIFYHTASRIWELGVGALLAFVPVKKKPSNLFTVIAIIGLVLGLLLFNEEISFPGPYAILPVVCAAFFIYSQSSILNTTGLIAIGKISYPLYLWHWVVFSFCQIYLAEFTISFKFAALLVSFTLSYLTYKFIEPIRWSRNKYISICLVALSLVIIVALQLFIVRSGGLPKRAHVQYMNDIIAQTTRTPRTDSNCIERVEKITEKEVLFNYCRASSKNTKLPTIAIIGDSHAHALYPGIQSYAEKHNFQTVMYANSSCPSLQGFPWSNKTVSVEKCQAKISHILKSIRLDQSIKKVIIATRGPTYINGEVRGDYSMKDINLSKKIVNNPLLTWETFSISLANTVNKLKKTIPEKNIFYLLENPELGFNPKKTKPRPLDYFNISVKKEGIEIEKYILRMDEYDQVIRKTQLKENFKIISSRKYLCEETICPAWLAGELAYADDDHLSVHGSHYFAKKIQDILFK